MRLVSKLYEELFKNSIRATKTIKKWAKNLKKKPHQKRYRWQIKI